MCIRDRVWSGAPLMKRYLGRAELSGAIIAAAGEQGAGAIPVSYTHLRAHETVLDLVCRLLLEKKKNHSRNPCTKSTDAT